MKYWGRLILKITKSEEFVEKLRTVSAFYFLLLILISALNLLGQRLRAIVEPDTNQKYGHSYQDWEQNGQGYYQSSQV
jgi:ABC-type dipeptide/oligopeptide/nickel transport system permease subunit